MKEMRDEGIESRQRNARLIRDMSQNEGCFAKLMETIKIPCRRVEDPKHVWKPQYVLTKWGGEEFYVEVRTLNGELLPEQVEEQEKLKAAGFEVYNYRKFGDLRDVLEPIWREIDENSGAAQRRRERREAQRAKEEREHAEALARKAERMARNGRHAPK